jgi:hypothetical protein
VPEKARGSVQKVVAIAVDCKISAIFQPLQLRQKVPKALFYAHAPARGSPCKARVVTPRGQESPGTILVQLSHHPEGIRASKVDRDGSAIGECQSFFGLHNRGVPVFPPQAIGAPGAPPGLEEGH